VLILDNPPGATYSVVRCYSGKELVGAPVVLKDVLRPYISLDIQTAGLLDYSVRGQDFAFLPSTNPTREALQASCFSLQRTAINPLPSISALVFRASR